MPANIESFARREGTEPAWHGLGGTWAPDATLDEKARKSGMAWEVLSSPVYYRAGDRAMVDKARQVFYRSDRPEITLGVMSDQFKPVQPRESLEFLEKLSNELDIDIDTAGVLGGGAKYWALATHNGNVEPLPGDRITDHLLIATANDGSMSTRIGPCRVRVVCQNTLTAAISGNSQLLTINHRTAVDWDKVRSWVMREHDDFTMFGELMHALSNVHVEAAQAAEFMHELIAPDWKPKTADDAAKAPRKLKSALDTLANGVGQREVRGTAYGILNGITRHIDHERGRTPETRLNSAWFGPGATLKNATLDKLVQDCVDKWGARDALAPVLRHTKYKELVA